MSTFQIRVPATSANLGPGFDSVGIALSKYVTLECQPADKWSFGVPEEDQPHIPSGKDNLIYMTAIYTATAYGYEELPPHHVELINDVPVARGLGSSSTAVVGGIELANQLLNLELSRYEKLQLACAIEGHPDNVAPAIYGGIMVSSYDGDHLDFVQFTKGLDDLTWLAIVPDFHLETEKARSLLPQEISYKQGVHASGTANVLVAALAEQNWELAGKMMMKDQWHQPYRKELIPDFDAIAVKVKELNAAGMYISGAGPTMIALFEQLSEDKLVLLQKELPAYQVEALQVDSHGLEVTSPSLPSRQAK
ncbi:homoserine kinase [Halobacillus halophilus]|uniref:Homoserine kinase n=1 Tax=Halobacillus halophilus (strain ATCC 35676 / DSM 2266 / JCM 20832 / KCTC 3685 / LMG 17431 / NBRC 102448 / NCIMB 2269) TaxID=866895 RepID=I0JRS0_HALH3|nr:homoserine kinase [Halobacillus halophilus]ASF40800.1 homoserine kinase [Halobacillus halophilus]CCG46841.1 homoserine kinase [Halobacillus halophilus DSM 2266]